MAITAASLFVVFLIWNMLLWQIWVFLAPKLKWQWIRHCIIAAGAILGVFLPIWELLHYLRFEASCDTNSGLTIYKPAKTDALYMEHSLLGFYGALNSPKVQHLVHKYVAHPSKNYLHLDEPKRFRVSGKYIDYSRMTKTTSQEDCEKSEYRYFYAAYQLARSGICLKAYELKEEPKYKLRAIVHQDYFDGTYWSPGRRQDIHFTLSSIETGELLSEYQNISIQMGPLMTMLTPYRYKRYTCEKAPFTEAFAGKSYHWLVTNFLDAALLD